MTIWMVAATFAGLAGVLVVIAFYQRGRRNWLSELAVRVGATPVGVTEAKEGQSERQLFDLIYRGQYRSVMDRQLQVLLTADPEVSTKFRRNKLLSLLGAVVWAALFFSSGMLLLLSLLVFFLPDLLVYNSVIKHKTDVRDALPHTVDLLGLCVESGLTFQSAVSRVSRMQGGPMGAELERLVGEVRLGVTPADAFLALAERTGEAQIFRLVNAINQVDRLGAPLTMVLKEQSHEFREVQRAKAREAAQKVPVKILGPIMLCFLPAMLIVVIGPAIAGVMRALSGF